MNGSHISEWQEFAVTLSNLGLLGLGFRAAQREGRAQQSLFQPVWVQGDLLDRDSESSGNAGRFLQGASQKLNK